MYIFRVAAAGKLWSLFKSQSYFELYILSLSNHLSISVENLQSLQIMHFLLVENLESAVFSHRSNLPTHFKNAKLKEIKQAVYAIM